jgi:hypothetical protein
MKRASRERGATTHPSGKRGRKGKTIWTCDTTGSLNLNSTLCERVHGTPKSPGLCVACVPVKSLQFRCIHASLVILSLLRNSGNYLRATPLFLCKFANVLFLNSCMIRRLATIPLFTTALQNLIAYSVRSTKATGSWFHENQKEVAIHDEAKGEWSILMYHSFTTRWRSRSCLKLSCRLPIFAVMVAVEAIPVGST